jgi:hypothetical protein
MTVENFLEAVNETRGYHKSTVTLWLTFSMNLNTL